MEAEINKALQVLESGGVIVYPTETIWGIGCDATNKEAVERVYKIKQRADAKSMLILLDTENRLPSYVEQVPELAWDLIEMADKPLTIIYPKGKNLASNLLADDGSVGIRITSNQFCKSLIFRFRKPIVSTSANISGQPSPVSFADVSETLLSQVDFVVSEEFASANTGKASGIIKLDVDGTVKVIRE